MPLLVAAMAAARSRPSPHEVSGTPRALLLGLVAGSVYFGGTLYWITGVMRLYGGLALPIAVAVNALLVAYLALFVAAFAGTVACLVRRIGVVAVLLAPAVWVATEWARGYLFGGFPWALLGYSQLPVLPIVQVASLAGVYGVSLLVVWVNAALAYAVSAAPRERRTVVAAVVVTLGVTAGWGAWRVGSGQLLASGEPLRVALLQGNIAQADKLAPERASMILDAYLALSIEAARQGARLVVWPESATPFAFEQSPAGQRAVRQLVRDTQVHLLLGSEQVETEPTLRYFNAAFLIRPNGETGGVYRKMRLVPFGEYVPLRSVLFFADRLVPSAVDFSPGEEATTLDVDGHLVSAAICYEVVYPDLIRQFVLGGSELLATVTNDAWFGRSSAPYQHFAQAAVRAVEQGRYLVRAANTGISGIVDPYGRVVERTAIFERDLVVGDVRLLRAQTVYARIGDVLAYGSVLLTGAALAVTRRRHSA